MSLLAFGEVLVDFLSDGKTPESFTKYPGGAPANVSVAYSKLGGYSMFCGAVGEDMFGDFLMDSLAQENVNTRYCIRTNEAKTALAFVSLDERGERSFSFYRPPAADLLFQSCDFQTSAFEQANIFHICSNSLTEKDIYQATLAGLTKAHQSGCICSFDINLRENLWTDISEANLRIWECIGQADVLKLSPEELDFLLSNDSGLTGINDVIDRAFSLGVSLVVHTQGDKPVAYYSQNQQGQVAIPVIEVVDTTAAGDAFVGGMLFKLSSKLKRGLPLSQIVASEAILTEIIEFATACGAHACQSEGAFPSLPTLLDLTEQQLDEDS